MKNTREFVGLSTALLGNHGWINGIARTLGVSQSTASKWKNGKADVPDSVIDQLRGMAGINSQIPEWIEGEGLDGQGGLKTYLIHTKWPRFIARLVDDDGLVDSHELGGLSVSVDGLELAGFVWHDEPKGLNNDDIIAMVGEAVDALVEMQKISSLG